MGRYRKKPVVIDAHQWDGDESALTLWLHEVDAPDLAVLVPAFDQHQDSKYILTLEGEMECQRGDWIIRGVKGEFYPCKPDIFEATYDAVPDAGQGDHDSE